MPNIQIMPSILAADFGRLAEGCQWAERSGADQIHVDVMDGVFVPNISFGPEAVRVSEEAVSIPLNVHLMITKPQDYIKVFVEAGSDTIQIHIESKCDVQETLQAIRGWGKRAAITLNPETPVERIFPCLENGWVDEVLVMSVHPGFGGQSYLSSAAEKISTIRRMANEIDIAIDGGIDNKTVVSAAAAGANLFVVGSYLFKQENMKSAISELRKLAQDNFCKAL